MPLPPPLPRRSLVTFPSNTEMALPYPDLCTLIPVSSPHLLDASLVLWSYNTLVTVAGLTAKNQHFSPVTTLSSSFSDNPIDGILGMAFPVLSNLNAVSLILHHFQRVTYLGL